MTGLVEEYLRQLRASLRTRPEETARILAEAEDHLRESVAAGRAAGLTETEAAEAAISSFGTVRAVARAHQTPRGQAVAALRGLFMAIWWLAGVGLTSVFAVGLIWIVLAAATGPHAGPPGQDPDPDPEALIGLVVVCGLLGLLLLWSYWSYSRARAATLQRSSGPWGDG
jgi:hypothetical protein